MLVGRGRGDGFYDISATLLVLDRQTLSVIVPI